MDKMDVLALKQSLVIRRGEFKSRLLLRLAPAGLRCGTDPHKPCPRRKRIIQQRQREVRMAMHLPDEPVSHHPHAESLHVFSPSQCLRGYYKVIAHSCPDRHQNAPVLRTGPFRSRQVTALCVPTTPILSRRVFSTAGVTFYANGYYSHDDPCWSPGREGR